MIVASFNAKEIFPVGRPIHLRGAIAVDGAAAAPDDGVGESPADRAWLPVFPRLFHEIGKSIHEEAAILIRRHEVRVILGLVVSPGA